MTQSAAQGRLAGKVILITGGAQGIGRGIAERCAAEGARTVIADRSPQREAVAEALRDEGRRAIAVPLDVRVAQDHEQAVAASMAEFGHIDVLVYCAGIFPRGTLRETDETLWHTVLDTNLTGAFLACQAVVPVMAEQKRGAIITIGSLHARRGAPDRLAYAVSKGGLVTLTLNLAAALASEGIRVNCVHPGWVMSEGEMALLGLTPEQAVEREAEMSPRMPLGRLQTPQDIAGAVVYLASDDASQVTGQLLAVDGGLSVRLP